MLALGCRAGKMEVELEVKVEEETASVVAVTRTKGIEAKRGVVGHPDAGMRSKLQYKLS
jgi:hypothetical protein